ncbi:MAG TPA: Ni/Fe hydrogenase subunit beta [Candidatus Omnitrophica bacterium]|nr:Ni/Fe hydrogenase subunit beta [Candidatus Omnitrophota bacterium]
MERYAKISKKDFNRWLESLEDHGKLYGPKKKDGRHVFRPIKDVKELDLNYISTILPPKKYYFPQKERLLKFKIKPFKTAKAIRKFEEFVLFGVHTCDIAGIQCMDVVFRQEPLDANYINRKDRMTTVGIECLTPCDKYANCVSMGNHVPKGGYDIMLTDVGNKYIIHINSAKAESILRQRSYIKKCISADRYLLDAVRKKKEKIFKEEFIGRLTELYAVFSKLYDSEIWKDVGKRCVGCGNCTAVCPTCYCFDVLDEVSLNLNDGLRYRLWNSCQMDDFAKVAGGEDFRPGRSARQRHRYYRKFKYPIDKFSRYFCTGCGRCSRTCMAEINLTETVNSLIREHRNVSIGI